MKFESGGIPRKNGTEKESNSVELHRYEGAKFSDKPNSQRDNFLIQKVLKVISRNGKHFNRAVAERKIL